MTLKIDERFVLKSGSYIEKIGQPFASYPVRAAAAQPGHFKLISLGGSLLADGRRFQNALDRVGLPVPDYRVHPPERLNVLP